MMWWLALALFLLARGRAENLARSVTENGSAVLDASDASTSAPGISEGRRLVGEVAARGGGFEVRRTSYKVPAKPRDDKARNRGPFDRGTTYGQNELFHHVRRNDGVEGLMWQVYGQNDVGKPIYLTWLSADKTTASSKEITTADFGNWLAGACTIGNGNILYMEVEDTTIWAGSQLMTGWTIPRTSNCQAWMVEYDPVREKEVDRTELDTKTIDLFDFAEQTASLRYDPQRNQVGVTFAHKMRQAWDGLNHQKASYFVWDVQSEKWTAAGVGSPGGHCFQGTMFTSSDYGFLGAWFCDNTPRGIQLFRLNDVNFDTFTVYQVKTRHGSVPENPSGVPASKYNEISGNGKTFYKWSNDNQVYGEIAMPGAVETDDGIVVFFSGEPPALDNSQMKDYEETVMMPRNLGWVKVGKNLRQKQVLSDGPVEKGGHYGYWDETWKPQEHRGINWLTDFKEKWLIMGKPKSVRLAPNRILLVWEQWHARAMTEADCEKLAAPGFVESCKGIVTAEWYDRSSDWVANLIRTQMMIVDDNVNVVKPVWSWEGGLVTPQGDAPQVVDGCAIIYVAREKEIQRYEVCEAWDVPADDTKPTDDPCFEPYPDFFRCLDSVDTAGGKGTGGVTTCPSGEACRVAKCHEVSHFCSGASMRENCHRTCGVCTDDQNEEPTAAFLEKIKFLDSCEVGSKHYGLPPPCWDDGNPPFMVGGTQATCGQVKDECDRPPVDEHGKPDDLGERMRQACRKTCGVCSGTGEPPVIDPIAPWPAATPAPAPAPGSGNSLAQTDNAGIVDGADGMRLSAAAVAAVLAALGLHVA